MPVMADGRRLHLHHGPIDLIIEATGAREAVQAAYDRAETAFPEVLPRLVADLAVLRKPLGDALPDVACPVSQAMVAACWPYRAVFITPMAAVAGAVADHMMGILVKGDDLDRAYVNNGGDIALHLTGHERFDIGVVADPRRADLFGRLSVHADQPVRGLATSGWRGRSFSLGIADAVTVLATTSAQADAAATIIANAVTVDHHAIHRVPANSLTEDNELGDLLVTVAVGSLPHAAVAEALDRGADMATRLVEAGQIFGAVLILGTDQRVIGGAKMLKNEGEETAP